MSSSASGDGLLATGSGRRTTGAPEAAPARVRRAGLLAALALAVAAAGCGIGAGKTPSGVQLTVTSDFGAVALGSWSAPRVHGEETVMSLLTRNAKVATRYGGGFVQSIDGVAGGRAAGRPVDWFYYVNGVEAGQGAAATRLRGGERIWWDRHDWSQTDHIPAVVGSFPEPFLHGLGGKRLPVRAECDSVAGVACRMVVSRLRASGVPAAVAALGTGAEPRTLRVLVAPWRRIAGDPVASAVAGGPAASGVYARFGAAGGSLVLLDAAGRASRTLGAGAGLIAATGPREDAPVWVVTGTDSAGVGRAARGFAKPVLRDRFALALPPGSESPVPLPVASR